MARLRERFPSIVGPASDDICYATQNRQEAVEAVAKEVQLILVVGSPNSSNSNRLVEVAQRCGVAARLIDDASGIQPEWLDGVESVGLTAGASAPEVLVQQVSQHLAKLGFTDQRDIDLIREDVRFTLPPELAQIAPAPAPKRKRAPKERVLAVKISRQMNGIALLGAPTSAASLARRPRTRTGGLARRRPAGAAARSRLSQSPTTAIARSESSLPTTSIHAHETWRKCWRRSRNCVRRSKSP